MSKGKSRRQKKNRVKIPVYFDSVREAPTLAMLEHFRVLSGLKSGDKDISMSRFIKFMAVEFCLQIEEAERRKVEQEKQAAQAELDLKKAEEERGKTVEEFADEFIEENSELMEKLAEDD